MGPCPYNEVERRGEAAILSSSVVSPVKDAAVAQSAVTGRILGGSFALPGQFPHQAAVYIDGATFCGGSLIADKWILTAAHCIDGGSTWTVHLGTIRLDSLMAGTVTINTRQAVAHDDFDPVYLTSDVGLIHLVVSVDYTDYIQPIPLPPSSMTSERFEGEQLTVSGWGRTSGTATGISPALKYVSVPVISNALCQLFFGNSVLSSTICTSGAALTGTCSGDSGGPLVAGSQDGNFTLVGVVSFISSYGCQLGFPAGYARVTSFLEWIAGKTGIAID